MMKRRLSIALAFFFLSTYLFSYPPIVSNTYGKASFNKDTNKDGA